MSISVANDCVSFQVRFSPEAALELHKQLFRSKVSTLMDKGKLDAADQEDLKRIKRILCIPPEVSKKVMKETVGEVLGEVLSNIFMAGAKPVPDIEMDRVDKVSGPGALRDRGRSF